MEDSRRHAPYAARMADRPTTRLAPTPSGALHVGNARTFLVNWALARNLGWRIVLRLEDLDLGRVKAGAHEAALEDMRWIGVDWDGEPEIQSRDLAPYRAALEQLAADGRVFRCDRSRAEIRSAASAPHAEDGETRYPPELRPPGPWPRAIAASGAGAWEANHRLRVDPAPERVHDEFLGDFTFDPGLECGDMVVWTKLGVPAYQLAMGENARKRSRFARGGASRARSGSRTRAGGMCRSCTETTASASRSATARTASPHCETRASPPSA